MESNVKSIQQGDQHRYEEFFSSQNVLEILDLGFRLIGGEYSSIKQCPPIVWANFESSVGKPFARQPKDGLVSFQTSFLFACHSFSLHCIALLSIFP